MFKDGNISNKAVIAVVVFLTILVGGVYYVFYFQGGGVEVPWIAPTTHPPEERGLVN